MGDLGDEKRSAKLVRSESGLAWRGANAGGEEVSVAEIKRWEVQFSTLHSSAFRKGGGGRPKGGEDGGALTTLE